MSAYVKSYDNETKWMNFLIKNYKLLQRYNDLWNKVSNSIKKEPEKNYNNKFLKTKIRSNNLAIYIIEALFYYEF